MNEVAPYRSYTQEKMNLQEHLEKELLRSFVSVIGKFWLHLQGQSLPPPHLSRKVILSDNKLHRVEPHSPRVDTILLLK